MDHLVLSNESFQKLISRTNQFIADTEVKLEELRTKNKTLKSMIEDPVTDDCAKMMEQIARAVENFKQQVAGKNGDITEIEINLTAGHEEV